MKGWIPIRWHKNRRDFNRKAFLLPNKCQNEWPFMCVCLMDKLIHKKDNKLRAIIGDFRVQSSFLPSIMFWKYDYYD